jgi:hypothetical protein
MRAAENTDACLSAYLWLCFSHASAAPAFRLIFLSLAEFFEK